ncbi:MAG: hypothetical protein JO059_13545, partial [Mycobacterium sp.]|nr:hypothetical protein [Mycobacterium sp.]
PPPPPFQYPYYEVRQAAADIEAPDQGTAFRAFATEWNRYQLAFQQEDYRFRPFLRWEGEARAAVEGNFTSQKQWISGMVGLCVTLAKQAQMVADAHKKVKPLGGYGNDDGTHPSVYEVAQCDATYKRYSEDRYLQQYLPSVVEWYELLQKRSETAISTYIGSAGVPLAALNPNAPYTAYVINPPPTPDPTPDKGDGDGEGTTPVDPVVPGPVPETPGDPAANVPTTPTTPTMPTTPMMPATGMGATPSTPSMPATPDAQAMVNAAMNKAGLPKGGPGAGVKPASVGGGGGAGMPTMPLQPATGGDAAPRPAGAGPGVATEGLGKGLPGAGGTGGGMGGMPLGGQGAKGEGKGKRVASEDDALYTEERAWTEGVIGNRPRKGATEK